MLIKAGSGRDMLSQFEMESELRDNAADFTTRGFWCFPPEILIAMIAHHVAIENALGNFEVRKGR